MITSPDHRTEDEFRADLEESRKACELSENGDTVEIRRTGGEVEKWREGKRVYHNFGGAQ